MDPLTTIKNNTLSICGIFARLRGGHISHDKALEECLSLTRSIDSSAATLEAAAANSRKANAKLSQEKYRLRNEIGRLEQCNSALQTRVDNIKSEKEKLDASLSSIFSDDDIAGSDVQQSQESAATQSQPLQQQ
jgi:predicted RNase H-like nuclease (RuvC/YqgF family)